VVKTGRSHLARFDPPHAYDEVRDRNLLTFARAIGMRAYYVVPLIARGRTLGALAALQAESGRAFTEDDCAMLDELGRRAALALDNARLYAEAQSARKEAERANRAKDEFLGILGHELRNPLAPIVWALHAMQKSEGDDTTAQRRVIERQVAHLSRLVDDLLDVSRITQGQIELRHEPVDLRHDIAKALELTQPMFQRRTRALDVELASTHCMVNGDDVRLAQVVSNLLINAAKFTPDPGAIYLRLDARDGMAAIEVRDEGAGIEASLIPHVFDLFIQGKQTIDRGAGGLGLGLAIVKTIVTMHGGSVEAHSGGVGQGSTFTVTLPVAQRTQQVSSTHAASSASPATRASRVLVVDDNRDAATTLRDVLAAYGFDVAMAFDGFAALATLESFAADVAVLDIGLPGMDGYALAARIVQSPVSQRPRLIALTGYGTSHHRERAFAAGFDDHLVKPVDPDQLVRVLDRVIETARR